MVRTFHRHIMTSGGRLARPARTAQSDSDRTLPAIPAAQTAETHIPDAVAHFGMTPDQLAAKIVARIPQVPAGAAIIAQGHAAVANTPATPPAA